MSSFGPKQRTFTAFVFFFQITAAHHTINLSGSILSACKCSWRGTPCQASYQSRSQTWASRIADRYHSSGRVSHEFLSFWHLNDDNELHAICGCICMNDMFYVSIPDLANRIAARASNHFQIRGWEHIVPGFPVRTASSNLHFSLLLYDRWWWWRRCVCHNHSTWTWNSEDEMKGGIPGSPIKMISSFIFKKRLPPQFLT